MSGFRIQILFVVAFYSHKLLLFALLVIILLAKKNKLLFDNICCTIKTGVFFCATTNIFF